MSQTAWSRGDVRWNLALRPSAERVRPQIFPAEQLGLFDMSLESAPSVTFDGWIEHRGRRFSVVEAAGMVSHYWGRELPREWWWVSANQFDVPDVAVECTALRSRVWGTRFTVRLGYFCYRAGPRRILLVAPPARIAVTGSPDDFEVLAAPLRGRRFRLKATGRGYASLGDGILNTLIGDIELWEDGRKVALARGTAALERKVDSTRA